MCRSQPLLLRLPVLLLLEGEAWGRWREGGAMCSWRQGGAMRRKLPLIWRLPVLLLVLVLLE
jgi:hypothetical protein